MSLYNVALGTAATTEFAILIPLYREDHAGLKTLSSVELKTYSQRFPAGLDLTLAEFNFLKDNVDLQAMIDANLIVVTMPEGTLLTPTAAPSVVKLIKPGTGNHKTALYVTIGDGKNVELVDYCVLFPNGLPLVQNELDAVMAATNYAALLAAQAIQISDPA